MHLAKSICRTVIAHNFSTLPRLSKIPSKYKPRAIKQAQQAITDYLHGTRSLPYTFAENIAKNSIYSLHNFIAKIDFSVPEFTRSLQKHLRYNPVNEFEFFFESIGISHSELSRFLPLNKFFFAEDVTVWKAACALSGFGFPWNKLGEMYKEEVSIFSMGSVEISSRLCELKNIGFSSITVIGVCMAFPRVLIGNGDLVMDLKRLFIECDLESCIKDNVDSWHEIWRKIRVFYDLGDQKSRMCDMICKRKSVLVENPVQVLLEKAEYFCRLGVLKEKVGFLLLERPDILHYDLETPVISVIGILKLFELSDEELKYVNEKYPYVFGRNKMANLPCAIRAMNLQEWFFDKISDGNHELLANYSLMDPYEDLDDEYQEYLGTVQSLRYWHHTSKKLNFLHAVGFGENALTLKVLKHAHGTDTELQERFKSLLGCGVDFSNLCRMMISAPKIMNQTPESLERKVSYLCGEMCSSLEYLDVFPAFLCFDLEKRIKPRYRFHKCLKEKGLCSINYAVSSMVATSEKAFIARLHGFHPAAPKQWFEFFSGRKSCIAD